MKREPEAGSLLLMPALFSRNNNPVKKEGQDSFMECS